jgi:hypothetical protein
MTTAGLSGVHLRAADSVLSAMPSCQLAGRRLLGATPGCDRGEMRLLVVRCRLYQRSPRWPLRQGLVSSANRCAGQC